MKPILFMDIECYSDYFLVQFMSETGKTVSFERCDSIDFNKHALRRLLELVELITFNGTGYDLPMLSAALYGANNRDLKTLSDEIIKSDIKPWQFYKSHCIPQEPVDHIDLIEVAPGIASLKLYGGRLHAHKMQDLPIEPDQSISLAQREQLRQYCKNDLELTQMLYNRLKPQIDLRREMSQTYGQDLRSKSDAQIAETVIISELTKLNHGIKPARARKQVGKFHYRAPDYLPPSEARNIAENCPFEVRANGLTYMPKELEKLKITLGGTTYQLGMGGLHSTEKAQSLTSCDAFKLYDWDVASYYPSIILNCGLFPQQLGKLFLDVYRTIVLERLQAKKDKDKIKADALKIVVNGSFGKLGSQYSALYAPDLMVQVTVTGQLSLLLLIEKLEQNGLSVVSGNTDGIVIKCPPEKEAHMKLIIRWWEGVTGFEMEKSEYSGLYSRDVNNYVAIKPDGEVKTKGCFSPAGLQKNAANEICNEALLARLKGGGLEETIRSCPDIKKFITIRTVKGGAMWQDEYVGKAVRWYYSTEGSAITYKSNGNKVARSDGCKPMMELSTGIPVDLDYEWYIEETKSLLKGVGL